MKRKLLKTIELLTDSMVPDNYEKIINKTTGVNIMKKEKNNFKVWKLATAVACCAVIAVTAFSVANFNNSIIAPNNPDNEITVSTTKDTNDAVIDNLIKDDVKFNDFAIYTTKIGGVRKDVELSEVKANYDISKLPDGAKGYLLCEESDVSEDKVFAGGLVYETGEAWFNCLISENEIVEPLNNEIRFSSINNNEIILSKNDDHYYATFEINGVYFAVEAEGYSDNTFVDMIKSLIE